MRWIRDKIIREGKEMKKIFVVAVVISVLALAFPALSAMTVFDEPDTAYLIGYADVTMDEFVIFLADCVEYKDGAGMLREYAKFEGVRDIYGGSGYAMIAFEPWSAFWMIPIPEEGGEPSEEVLDEAVEYLKQVYSDWKN